MRAPLHLAAEPGRESEDACALGEGIVVLPTAPERHRNADTHYDYRWDSGFYYLTGFREPEAVLVMVLGAKPRSILFCREKNLEREIWDGYRYGPEAAREMFGFDEAYAIDELDGRLPDLASDRPALFTPLGLFEPSWAARNVRVYEIDIRGEASGAVVQEAMRRAIVRATGSGAGCPGSSATGPSASSRSPGGVADACPLRRFMAISAAGTWRDRPACRPSGNSPPRNPRCGSAHKTRRP